MSTNKINQKEYLKKYLSADVTESKKKKKKRKDKSDNKSTVKIVDDDIDLSQLANATEEDLDNYNLGEDLPQIAGIIDERPAELIAKEDYKTSGKWKTIGKDEIEPMRSLRKCDIMNHSNGNKYSRVAKRSSDDSPPKRSKRSPDASPPRRSKRSPDASPPRRSKRSPDASPPRRSKRSPDASPPRRSKRSPDASPPRRSKRSPDASPPRRTERSPDASPLRRSERSPDASPSRRSKRNPDKMVKTLEGKRAGLQHANALRVENEQFRKREAAMFKEMDKRQKHEDTHTVRSRKTGRRGNLHEDQEKEREKLKKEEERKQVYDRWGRGLKQLEEYKSRVDTETHEMSKPVARYANDEDLEDYQRNQYRDGDPMSEYFKKKAVASQSGPCKPIYQGSFPENRFNIRPGYRWDGVDRSNGYEKKWFEVLNQKKATEEEAYKYSVEDM